MSKQNGFEFRNLVRVLNLIIEKSVARKKRADNRDTSINCKYLNTVYFDVFSNENDALIFRNHLKNKFYLLDFNGRRMGAAFASSGLNSAQ